MSTWEPEKSLCTTSLILVATSPIAVMTENTKSDDSLNSILDRHEKTPQVRFELFSKKTS